jgi:isoleucyl-tRNA synthetase
MLTNAQPWDNLKFDPDGVTEVQRKFFGTLHNTYGFFALYANVDGFDPKAPQVPHRDRPELDRWILSRLHSVVAEATEAMEAYEPTRAFRPVADFVVDELSNWYVRLSRRRFWKGAMGDDKLSAFQTLRECLDTVARLMAPLAPFYAEQLYRDLNGPSASVHWSRFPEADPARIDTDLERRMDLAQRMTSLVLSVRKKERVRVRQPLPRIVVPVLNPTQHADLDAIEELLLSEVNVKTLERVEPNSGLFVQRAKPDFKALGPKVGPRMKTVSAALSALTDAQLRSLEQDGQLELELADGPYTVEPGDVMVVTDDIPGMSVASERGTLLAVDLQLSPELVTEGLAREAVNRIQNLRKDSGLDITDRIELWISGAAEALEAVAKHRDYVAAETLVAQWGQGSEPIDAHATETDLEGLAVTLALKKA